MLRLDRARLRSRLKPLLPLAVLLVAGGVLRLLLMLAVRPALLGYADSGTYIDGARRNIFMYQTHPAGYSLFLRIVHQVSDHLSATILLQHLLGMAAAVFLYAAVRRCGFPRWAALVPAAVVLLSGSEVFLEHAPLSEALYTVLFAAGLYAITLVLDRPGFQVVFVAAVLATLAGLVRVTGFVLVPLLLLAALLAAGRPLRARLGHVALALGVTAALMAGYVDAQHSYTGYTGLTRAGMWNLYGRVAPFADCDKIHPPRRARVLCEDTPTKKRPAPGQYVFDAGVSPAIKHFGGPRVASDEANDALAAFARGAIVHQPFDYLWTVTRAMLRYARPAHGSTKEGSTYDYFFHTQLFDPGWTARVRLFALGWYGAAQGGSHVDKGLLDALLDYESATQLKGIPMILLLLLSLASIPAVAAPARRAALIFFLAAWASLVLPVATVWWDARLAVPAFGPLAASAAIGASGLGTRLRHRLRG